MITKHCVQCGAVHEKRGYFCDPECHKAYRKAKRDEKAQNGKFETKTVAETEHP